MHRLDSKTGRPWGVDEILPTKWFLPNCALVIHKTTLERHISVDTTCMLHDLASLYRYLAALVVRQTSLQATILHRIVKVLRSAERALREQRISGVCGRLGAN